MIFYGYIISILYGILCLGIGVIAHKLGMPKKYSRKIVHILVCFEWLILYKFMGTSYHFLIVCLLFTVLLLITYRKNILPMMSSDGDNAPGTVYYGVSMSVLAFLIIFIPRLAVPFGIGAFCTSFGDGFAGVIGQLIKHHNPKIYSNKTLFGLIANFIFSFAVVYIFDFSCNLGLNVYMCLAVAFLSTTVELLSSRGLDNIFVTLSTAFLSYAFLYIETVNHYIVPILLTPVIILAVNKKAVLTKLGLVFALILDLVISLTLGNFGLILLASFLFLSVLVDKVKNLGKNPDLIAKKGNCRDHIQVMANGLVPMMLAVIFSITLNKAYLIAYVATLAEAFGDTAASGMGVFSKSTYDPFRMKKCECGISGGMSLIGTFSSLLAAFVISLIAFAFGAVNLEMMLLAVATAFLGVIFDSFLGSIVQVKYSCTVCGKITEREQHCKKRTKKISGFEFFDNDVVNLFSGLFTALITVILSSLIL